MGRTKYEDTSTETEKKYVISSLGSIKDLVGNNGKQPLDLQLFNKSLRIRDLQSVFDFIWSSKFVTILDLGR